MKENDEETGWQNYGFRLYHSGIGKFLSVDPLSSSYPFYSSYQFAGNMPIAADDLDGLEERIRIYSPQQVSSVQKAFDNDDIGTALRIARYAVQNKFVNDQGQTSTFAQRQFEGKFPSSAIQFPSGNKAGEVSYTAQLGIFIEGLNHQTGEFEQIGVIPVSSEAPGLSSSPLLELLRSRDNETLSKNITPIKVNERGGGGTAPSPSGAFGGNTNPLESDDAPIIEGSNPFSVDYKKTPGDSGVYLDPATGKYMKGVRMQPGSGMSPQGARPLLDDEINQYQNNKSQ